jgi:hypothetical protein
LYLKDLGEPMVIKKESEPLMVDSAQNALIKSIHHYILLNINLPSESVDCISQLFIAMELLLRVYFIRDDIFDDVNEVNSSTLIETYHIWTREEKAIAHRLRHLRNIVMHEGELQKDEIEEVNPIEIIIETIKKSYVLVDGLYEELDYPVSEIFFSDLVLSILSGDEPKWYDLAKSLIIAGNQYMEIDVAIVKDIFFGALDIAIRGFAKSWRVENIEELTLIEIINVLDDYEYEFECKYNSGDWLPEWYPYYLSSYDRMNEEKYLRDIIEMDEVELRGFTDFWGPIHGFQLYLQVIEAAVMQLVYRYPSLDFFECLCNRWDDIMDEMIRQNPEIKKLELNDERGIDVMWDAGRCVSINIIGEYSDYGWEEKHKDHLREIIDRTCGPIPKDLRLDFHPSFKGI